MNTHHQTVVPPKTEALEEAIPLDRVPAGNCGLVCRIEVAEADLQRLQIMGICLGRWVHIVKQGDPMIVRVMGSRIGLAAKLATFVYVTPQDGV
jgi:Fe2+ transport system protein FeoA